MENNSSNNEDCLKSKHVTKLQHSWTFWKNDKSRPEKVDTFNTVEEFWHIYNTLKKNCKLFRGDEYSIFKEGCEKVNYRKWTYFIKKDGWITLDKIWSSTMMLIMKEKYIVDEIEGVILVIKKKSVMINIWSKITSDISLTSKLRRLLKDIFGFRFAQSKIKNVSMLV